MTDPLLPDHSFVAARGLGVHSLLGFDLVVPDLPLAERFYRGFGLAVGSGPQGLVLSVPGQATRVATLTEGSAKRLQQLVFGAFAKDLPHFAARLEQQGIPRVAPPAGEPADSLWFRDPDGLLLGLRAAALPPVPLPPEPTRTPQPGRRSAVFRDEAPASRVLRLAHVMVFVSDLWPAIGFYRDVLGLRLTDEVGGHVAFLHAPHGSDHHILALLKSTGPGLHHCSWDVGSVDAIGHGATQMAGLGYREGWGLGRFVLGSNYFHYVRDPWGSYSEYVSHTDWIPAGTDWPGQSHRAERAFYLWGPGPPPDFSVNHELKKTP